MERTWVTSSAARTSRSRLGSELTDSTGMPSRATSDRARAPSMRLLIRLSWSRNIALAPPPDALQVALQKERLAGPPLPFARPAARLIPREQTVCVERPRCRRFGDPGGRRLGELLQTFSRRGALRLAAQDLAEDPLGLHRIALAQVELAQRGRGDRLGCGGDRWRRGR